MQLSDSLIERAWSNLSGPGGLGSLSDFARSRKNPTNLKSLEKSLSRIPAFSMHRPIRKKIRRPAIIINRPFYSWCCDLIMMPDKWHNAGNAYILLIKDQFTKMIALEALKHKSADETAAAMKKAMLRLSLNGKRMCKLLTHDSGVEFLNSKVRLLLKKFGVEQRAITSRNKASQCERQNKWVQDYIYRFLTLNNTKSWLKILPDLEYKYNHTKNFATLMAPADITEKNSGIAFVNMYRHLLEKERKPPAYNVGDHVRISVKQNIFAKKYKPQYSKSIYKIVKVKDTYPMYSFRLEDSSGKELEQTFVPDELSLATVDP